MSQPKQSWTGVDVHTPARRDAGRVNGITRGEHSVQSLTAQAMQKGILDDQFPMLWTLQDESSPRFVAEMLGMYVSDGREKVGKLTSTLLGVPCVGPLSDSYPNGVSTTPVVDGLAQSTRRAVSLSAIDDAVHQFKGGSCSLGCTKVAGACTRMRDAIKSGSEPDMRAAAQAVCDTYLEAEEVIMGILSMLG